MFPINEFKVQTVSNDGQEGLFKIEPLPKGYAHTIGTVFRRILLSSIPGAAVTGIKIEGVQHEYTTITGLHEDVLSVVLALKGIAVVSHTNDPVVLKLEVSGEKGKARTVTAADIEKNPLIEISNPEYVITTLADEKSKLVAELTIERGVGYALPDESVRDQVGSIPVDAVFSPVRLVAIDSKNARVGQQTDLDSLEIKIVTNGTIAPTAAFYQAAEILNTMSAHMIEVSKGLLDARAMEIVENTSLPVSQGAESDSSDSAPLLVNDLKLSTRLTNALVNSGYTDLRSLEGLTEDEVRNIKGMGDKSFVELMDVVKENNIKLI